MTSVNQSRLMLVTSSGFPADQADEIRADTPQAEYVVVRDEKDSIFDSIDGVNGLVGCPRHVFSKDLLLKVGSSLRWVHVSGAGCEEFLIPALMESPVILTNGRVIQGPEVADHAMALLLCLTRNIKSVLQEKSSGGVPRPIELRGKTAVIIGGGGIGLLVAERAAAFGMRILIVNPELLPMLRIVETVYPPDRLHEALAHADVTFMAAPHTWDTEGVMNAAAFVAMKAGGYFINVSRGKTVVTQALVNALKRGRLCGAGLDVTDPEPLPPDHPLRRMDNVVLTPHIAGLSEHNRRRSFELIKTNVKRFITGLPLLNIVDKRLGY